MGHRTMPAYYVYTSFDSIDRKTGGIPCFGCWKYFAKVRWGFESTLMKCGPRSERKIGSIWA